MGQILKEVKHTRLKHNYKLAQPSTVNWISILISPQKAESILQIITKKISEQT